MRPQVKEKKQRMSLYLTPTVKSQLEILAELEKRTINNTVEVLILDAIKKANIDKIKSSN